ERPRRLVGAEGDHRPVAGNPEAAVAARDELIGNVREAAQAFECEDGARHLLAAGSAPSTVAARTSRSAPAAVSAGLALATPSAVAARTAGTFHRAARRTVRRRTRPRDEQQHRRSRARATRPNHGPPPRHAQPTTPPSLPAPSPCTGAPAPTRKRGVAERLDLGAHDGQWLLRHEDEAAAGALAITCARGGRW